MSTGTIGTFAQQNQMLQSILQLRSQANDLQAQVSTGLKSQNYSGLGPAATQVANLQSAVSHRQAYLDTIGTVQQRIQEQSNVLSTIQDLAQKFSQLLPSGAFNATPSDIQTQAKALLQELGDFLNTSDGSRYLFSGSLTNTAPFVAADLPNPGSLGTAVNQPAPAGYYAGNDTAQQAKIDDNVTISYGVTADNSAIENVVRVANYLANLPSGSPSSNNPADVAAMNQAASLMTQGVAGLQQIEGTLALQSAQLQQVQQNHQNFINLTQTNIQSLESVDPATAITQLNQVETNLQASYQTVSALQQLSLVNYLK
ncbi:MAG TPA: flagellin [Stellaceae bacterium]|nr:flagellin [Stellaceae bacterium]